ncbi:MAG TPA: NAD(P)-binding domain-containing protein, partial [Novosphingobium sp.]
MKVGFIGLGSIGIFMARRLPQVGFEVTGCDIVPEMLAAFDEPGTHRESDPIATARAAEILGICVRTDAQLKALTADGTLFAALGEG